MKFVILALTLLLGGVDWTAVSPLVDKSVVRLEMMTADSKGSCSGSVINNKHGEMKGVILTAAHCVPSGPEYEYSLTANDRDARLIKLNRIKDLALLSFTVKGETAIALAVSTPPIGTEVAVVGFGFGITQPAKQFGHISLVNSGDGVWADAMTLFGDSGGPVIDGQARLVAVNSKIQYTGPAHISLAARIEDVRDFVAAYLPPTKQ